MRDALLNSLQYVGDDLIETMAAEAEPARRPLRPWLGWAVAAACVCVAAGAVFAAPKPASPEETAIGAAPTTELAQTGPGAALGEPVPGGTTAADAQTPERLHIVWNEVTAAKPMEADLGPWAGAMRVGEALTAEQLRACMPEILDAWMDDWSGTAEYYLAEGRGGLARIELRLSGPEGLALTAVLRDAALPDEPDCVLLPTPETVTGAAQGLEYTAWREQYLRGEGDPALNPPVEMAALHIRFTRSGVTYTLGCETPRMQEPAAKEALGALLSCYAGSHGAPDLDSFHWGEHVVVNRELTPEEARTDADFGAYFPAAAPEGFVCDSVRRLRLDDEQNELFAVWYKDLDRGYFVYSDLEWYVCFAGEADLARRTTAAARETYDLSLYPGPWYQAAPPELRETLECPVFPVDELSEDVIAARQRAGDDGLWTARFCVLYDGGVLVRVSAKNVDAAWLWAQLSTLG